LALGNFILLKFLWYTLWFMN